MIDDVTAYCSIINIHGMGFYGYGNVDFESAEFNGVSFLGGL